MPHACAWPACLHASACPCLLGCSAYSVLPTDSSPPTPTHPPTRPSSPLPPSCLPLASHQTGIPARQAVLGHTLAGLQELVMYGLKGLAAYAHHAEALGRNDPKVYAFVQEALHFLGSSAAADVPTVLGMCLKTGECNFRVMQMLSEAHTTT